LPPIVASGLNPWQNAGIFDMCAWVKPIAAAIGRETVVSAGNGGRVTADMDWERTAVDANRWRRNAPRIEIRGYRMRQPSSKPSGSYALRPSVLSCVWYCTWPAPTPRFHPPANPMALRRVASYCSVGFEPVAKRRDLRYARWVRPIAAAIGPIVAAIGRETVVSVGSGRVTADMDW